MAARISEKMDGWSDSPGVEVVDTNRATVRISPLPFVSSVNGSLAASLGEAFFGRPQSRRVFPLSQCLIGNCRSLPRDLPALSSLLRHSHTAPWLTVFSDIATAQCR